MEKLLQAERQKTTLATEIIRTLKKIVYMLIVTNIVTMGAFIWYISLPVEVTEQSVSQQSDNASTNNYIEGDYIDGETNNN